MDREKIEALEEALDKVLRVRDLYTVEYTSTWSSESKEILKKLAEVQFTLMDIKWDAVRSLVRVAELEKKYT